MVFAGRIEREKGVVELLEHWPAAFGGRLTIVGDGSLLGRCRAVCERRKLEDRVEFTGHVPNDRARSIIERSHVVVLPSLWVENHPVSLLEALAGGTNILVSNLGGMREIVEESGTGFVFDPDDPASLAAALNRITERFRQGTLNEFDASAFLADRSPDRYLQRVLDAYGAR